MLHFGFYLLSEVPLNPFGSVVTHQVFFIYSFGLFSSVDPRVVVSRNW